MKISKLISAFALIAMGFALGLFYPTNSKKTDPDILTNDEAAVKAYVASHKADIDLLVINEGFFYNRPSLIEVHKYRPDIMCRDLAHKFGLLKDKSEIERRIDSLAPGDIIPAWQKDLYKASANYLRENCGKYAAKWTAESQVWKSYKKAVKFATITQ